MAEVHSTGDGAGCAMPSSRAAAVAIGATHYFTGTPCKNGHVAAKHVKGGCVECQRERASEWAQANQDRREEVTRKWREQNREQIREAYRKKSEANPGLMAEIAREWRKKNPDKARKAGAKWRSNNPDKDRAKQLRRRAEKPEKVKAEKLQWKRANLHKLAAYTNKRRAAKLRASPQWLTAAHWAEIDAIYHLSSLLSQITGQSHHVDHIVPLLGKTVCGLHVPWNLRAVPSIVNLSKGARLDLDHLASELDHALLDDVRQFRPHEPPAPERQHCEP